MRLFRRSKRTSPTVPPEVEEYYQAERRSRRGLTWAMTIITIAATIAIVVGLFLAGRWLYRTVNHSDAPSTSSSDNSGSATNGDEHKDQSGASADDSGDAAQSGSQSGDQRDSGSSDSDTSQSQDEDGHTGGSSQSEDSSKNSDTSSSGSPVGQTHPQDSLANTGPGDSALIIFGVASVLGYVVYRRKLALSSRR